MTWRWEGPAENVLGDPVTGTTWTSLCVYDGTGLAWQVTYGPQTHPDHDNCNGYELPGLEDPTKPLVPCWFEKRGGWRYKNRPSDPHGVVLLEAYPFRGTLQRIKQRAFGVYMTNPRPGYPFRLPVGPSSVALLMMEEHRPETLRCWRSDH